MLLLNQILREGLYTETHYKTNKYMKDDMFMALALEDLVKDPVIRQVFGMKLLTDDNKSNDLLGLFMLDTEGVMPKTPEVNNMFIN